MSGYEQDLLAALGGRFPSQGAFRIDPDAAKYVVRLQAMFPFVGSQIDWEKVPGAVSRSVDASDTAAYRKQTKELISDARRLGGLDDETRIIVVGDSQLEVAIELSLRQFEDALDDFLDVPQHTYALAPDASWCLALTMEGYLDFGRSPGSTTSP